MGLANSKERQAWYDKLVAVFKEPAFASETNGLREWTRNHPIQCPVCGKNFFSYQAVDNPMNPYPDQREDVNRQTCGHPICWDVEAKRHSDYGGQYSLACQNYTSAKAVASAPSKKQNEIIPLARAVQKNDI